MQRICAAARDAESSTENVRRRGSGLLPRVPARYAAVRCGCLLHRAWLAACS